MSCSDYIKDKSKGIGNRQQALVVLLLGTTELIFPSVADCSRSFGV